MSKETGGPAFPGLHPSAECRYKEEGMTLRDYFAAKAVTVLFSTYAASADKVGWDVGWQTGIAIDAYSVADAMLKARDA